MGKGVHGYPELLFIIGSVVLLRACEFSRYELLAIAVVDVKTDSFTRLRLSAEKWDIDLKGINPLQNSGSESENKDEVALSKWKQVVMELEPYADMDPIIIFLPDGLDLMINGDKENIVCQFLAACNDCHILLPGRMEDEERLLTTSLMMGFASKLLEVLNNVIKQTPHPLLHNNSYLKENFKLEFDWRRQLMQNTYNAKREVILEFEDSDDPKVHNILHDTYPSLIYGNESGRLHFNHLSNYIGKASCTYVGCSLYNDQRLTVLNERSESDWPTVTVGLFIVRPTPFISEFFATVLKFSYPPSKIDLYVYNSQEYNQKDVDSFVKRARKTYRSVEYDSFNDFGVGEREARRTVLHLSEKASNDFVFLLDGDVHLVNADALRLLVEIAISGQIQILAPLVVIEGKLFSNFWGSLDSNGYYARSEDYVEIVDRKRVGVWNVPFINGAVLVSREKVRLLNDTFIYNLEVDPDMSFCEFARKNNHFLHVDNQYYYGFLIESENFNTNGKRVHPEMYEIFRNRRLWELRYVHPQYFAALNGSLNIHQPCPDVYEYPVLSENFAKELIEETENFGKWSGEYIKDHGLSYGYETFTTGYIHMKQIDFEQEWLHFLDQYVRPMQEKIFIGYYQRPVESSVMFIVRDNKGEEPSLRPYYDGSTYMVNIPLSKQGCDFKGGEVHYVRYNCTVLASEIGYATMFPGRLTHYHVGYPVTEGTRYIAVSLLNP